MAKINIHLHLKFVEPTVEQHLFFVHVDTKANSVAYAR